MSMLASILLRELDAFDGSDAERLQAIGALRAGTWVSAISVIADLEGATQARASLEALAQADTLLVVLALGWFPGHSRPRDPTPLTEKAQTLHHRLVRSLEIWLAKDHTDPSRTVKAVEQAYRATLSRTLGQTTNDALDSFLAIHYGFRWEIFRAALALIGDAPTRPRHVPGPGAAQLHSRLPSSARSTACMPSSQASSSPVPPSKPEGNPPSGG